MALSISCDFAPVEIVTRAYGKAAEDSPEPSARLLAKVALGGEVEKKGVARIAEEVDEKGSGRGVLGEATPSERTTVGGEVDGSVEVPKVD